MIKGKDFYGQDISEVIDQACRALGASREELDIEVLEAGSAGIFGLCKKKAHIRVQRKQGEPEERTENPAPVASPQDEEIAAPSVAAAPPAAAALPAPSRSRRPVKSASGDQHAGTNEDSKEMTEAVVEEIDTSEEEQPLTPPSEEDLKFIQADLSKMLMLMGRPSEVQVAYEDNTVQCTISGPHEEQIVGPEGRTLDSLQYLLRKMVATHLPEKIMLSLNAGDFRERRAEELKIRAVELAELVKTDGKTQAIPALNPSERRIVHMILQEDNGVRSRSVGEGVFKKVLIYKPGKGRRPASRRRRGGQGGRQSGD